MPADKDAAKRRRQARNRQEREARQARTEAAKRSAARPARTATETPPAKGAKAMKGAKPAKGATNAPVGKDGRPARTSLAKDDAAPARERSGILGTLFPPRPEPAAKGPNGRPVRTARPPSEVVEVDAGGGVRGFIATASAQPGGRPVLLALFAALVSAFTLLAFPVLPSPDLTAYGERVVEASVLADGGDDGDVTEAQREMQTNPVAMVRALELRPPQVFFAIGSMVVPLAIAYVAVRSLTRTTRSRTLMVSAIGAFMFILFAPSGALYFVLVALALGWGAFQSSKADKAAAAAAG